MGIDRPMLKTHFFQGNFRGVWSWFVSLGLLPRADLEEGPARASFFVPWVLMIAYKSGRNWLLLGLRWAHVWPHVSLRMMLKCLVSSLLFARCQSRFFVPRSTGSVAVFASKCPFLYASFSLALLLSSSSSPFSVLILGRCATNLSEENLQTNIKKRGFRQVQGSFPS